MLMLERVGFLNLDAGKPWKGGYKDPPPLSDRQQHLLEAADGGYAARTFSPRSSTSQKTR